MSIDKVRVADLGALWRFTSTYGQRADHIVDIDITLVCVGSG